MKNTNKGQVAIGLLALGVITLGFLGFGSMVLVNDRMIEKSVESSIAEEKLGTGFTLDVFKVSSDIITPRNSINGFQIPLLGSSGSPVLTVDASGTFSTTTQSGGGVIVINDISTSTFDFIAGTGVTISSSTAGDGTGNITINATGGGGGGTSFWVQSGTDLYTSSTIDQVGINTIAPSSSLHVVGTFQTTGNATFESGIIISGDTINDFNGTGLAINSNVLDVEGLTTTEFATTSISQWNNDSGYVTSTHDAVTLAGEDFLSLSTQQITAIAINPDNLANTDFGDWSCDGTTCTLDATYLTGNETITLSGDVSGSGETAITTTIGANKVLESHLKAVNSATDEDILTYESTTGDFEWHTPTELSLQAQGAVLDDLNTLGANSANSEFLVGTGAGALAWESGATARTSLGVDVAGTDNSTDVTITGEDYLTLSSQQITMVAINPDNLANTDFGEFTCNGTTCVLEATNTTITTLANLTTVGTIGAGTWEGTTVAILQGGTGATSLDDVVGTANEITVTDGANSIIGGNVTISIPATINFGGKTSFEIVNAASPTVDTAGEIALDTTDNQFLIADSGGTVFVASMKVQKIWGVTIASTTQAYIDGGTLAIPTQLDGYTMTAIRCKVDGGTSKIIAIEDASANSTEDITCATTVTSDDGSITNATSTAAEEMYIDFGAVSGAVDTVSISVFGTWTRE